MGRPRAASNKGTMKTRRRIFCAIALLFALSCAHAQTTGTLRGTVKDPSGAVVPKATVTAVEQRTNVSRSTTAGEQGGYEFPALPVGSYEVDVTAPGFKRFVQRDIDVTLGHVVIADAQLQLGTLTEVVSTEAAAPLVETTNTQQIGRAH